MPVIGPSEVVPLSTWAGMVAAVSGLEPDGLRRGRALYRVITSELLRHIPDHSGREQVAEVCTRLVEVHYRDDPSAIPDGSAEHDEAFRHATDAIIATQKAVHGGVISENVGTAVRYQMLGDLAGCAHALSLTVDPASIIDAVVSSCTTADFHAEAAVRIIVAGGSTDFAQDVARAAGNAGRWPSWAQQAMESVSRTGSFDATALLDAVSALIVDGLPDDQAQIAAQLILDGLDVTTARAAAAELAG